MASLLLYGDLTIKKARSFIIELHNASLKSPTIYIRIKSHGGNLRAYAEIADAMLELSGKGITIIGQAEEVGSAALLIYVNCHERWVTPSSYGFIHLPVPNKSGVSKKEEAIVRQKIVSFLEERTKLPPETIISLDNVPLIGEQLMQYGIATKKVSSFSLVTAETV